MTTSAELEIPTVTVAPGGEATTRLTVRNTSDIVEAYALEVVGDCAAWTTVEPPRVSLYPGTAQEVTVRLAPPRAPEIRAGQVPLGIRVLPAEHPESVSVSETTVFIEAFRDLRAELVPQRRRGWRSAKYRTELRNLGNAPVGLTVGGRQNGEELTFAFTPATRRLEPGESSDIRVRTKVQRLIWFGQPSTWPFEVDVVEGAPTGPASTGDSPGATATGASTSTGSTGTAKDPVVPETHADVEHHTPVQGEFVQVPLLPRWLLVLLAALLALILAWFTLIRPAVRSTAEEAADKAVKEAPAAADKEPGADGDGSSPGGKGDPSQGPGGGGSDGSQGTGAGGAGTATDTTAVPGTGRQSSATIDIETDGGSQKVGTYRVPKGKVLGITDAVVANFQGDEGVLTITFGAHKVTTIALETFRNQDYHWVTPIRIPENSTVTAAVTCAKPGTPASGNQASGCHEVLNVSGVLSDLKR
ncbi:hydrolytic protein [Streptomyces sp. NPDC002564]|uniref:COG1470 family protein n=1 Tax=Streptomyces sp. NPDC002564 TaxID=3364649 RepID=UPI0036C995D2